MFQRNGRLMLWHGSSSSLIRSHPFSSDPIRNANCVVPVARAIALAGDLPLAPQLYLPQFIDEGSERSLAMKLCLGFLARSDEIRVHGQPTDGMRLEIAAAERLGIPLVRKKMS